MDYTLHEWVRMASHHGSIARCAIEKQAEESGLDALAVREKCAITCVSCRRRCSRGWMSACAALPG